MTQPLDVTAATKCSACNEHTPVVAAVIGATTHQLCEGCGRSAADMLSNKLWQLNCSTLSRAELTEREVASIATYPLGLLLDELVDCTVRWRVGPLDADECRIVTALLERLAVLGVARKTHQIGCKIWPAGGRLCKCPWEVAA